MARGLIRVDRQGRADGPAYHPLHPEVRAALKRRVSQAIAPHRSRPSLTGVLIRLGPGPTLLGGPDTGFDDATYARFVRETFDPETARGVPGLGTSDPNRFAARAQFLAGSGRMPWLTWRSRGIASLYAELAESVRRRPPAASLAVATPGLEDDPAGHEARRVDLAGLAPSHAWRAVGLDLETSLARRRGPPRSSSAAPASRPTRWRTTWPPAPSSTPWSPVAPAGACCWPPRRRGPRRSSSRSRTRTGIRARDSRGTRDYA